MILKLQKTYIGPALVTENVIILQFIYNRLRDYDYLLLFAFDARSNFYLAGNVAYKHKCRNRRINKIMLLRGRHINIQIASSYIANPQTQSQCKHELNFNFILK